MAKVQRYSDEQLNDAVIQYSSVCNGKIKATELAEWTRCNVTGLEEITRDMFTRPITVKDKKGKTKKVKRPCAVLIEDINRSRDATQLGKNVLFSLTNVDDVLDLSRPQLRKALLEARAIVADLIRQRARDENNKRLIEEKDAQIKELSNLLNEKMPDISAQMEQIRKVQNGILKNVSKEQRRKAAELIGISEVGLDLNKSIEHLQVDADEVFRISSVIKSQNSVSKTLDKDDVLNGFDFDS